MKTGNITSIIKKIPTPEKRIFWFCFIVIIKFASLFFFIDQHRPSLLAETIGVCSGDCESYLSPIDQLLESGNYSPDYRMPGYGVPYLAFRSFFDKNMSVSLLVIFQTFMDAIAVLLLSFALYRITQKKSAFYMVMFFYGIGLSVSCYNNWILTESLTASALSIGFYFLIRHSFEKKPVLLILSGLFFTWAYFLRPVNAGVVIAITALLFIFSKGNRLRYSIYFLIPAMLFNGAWTIRNYQLKKKLFLLTEHTYAYDFYRDYGMAALEFCKTFSDFKVTMSYFEDMGLKYFGQSIQTTQQNDIIIPPEIFTKDFNADSLLLIRSYFDEKKVPGISPERNKQLEDSITQKMRRYESSIRKYHPYIVYVKTPIILTKDFVLQSGIHNLFFMPYSFLTQTQKAAKIFFVGIYFLAFMGFLAGLLFYYNQIIDNKMILTAYLIAFYIIFIHSVFLRSIELRYLIPCYPFFVTGVVFTLNELKNLIQKKY